MDYNTERKKLILPEYGRNIQIMVSHLLTIDNRDERNRAAQAVIDVMGNVSPHLRDVSDFRHKLWDHLAIMSDFKLDIDSPYPTPSINKLYEKPDRLSYSSNKIKYRHYGKLTERLVDKIKEKESGEERDELFRLAANYMKKSFLVWNKESVEDEHITNDLCEYLGSKSYMPQDLNLSATKDILVKKNNRTNYRKPTNKRWKKQ